MCAAALHTQWHCHHSSEQCVTGCALWKTQKNRSDSPWDGGGGPVIAVHHATGNNQALSVAWDIGCFDCLWLLWHHWEASREFVTALITVTCDPTFNNTCKTQWLVSHRIHAILNHTSQTASYHTEPYHTISNHTKQYLWIDEHTHLKCPLDYINFTCK